MRPFTVLLVILAVAAGCAAPAPALPTDRLVIVTVADTGGSRMPARGYHQPGYRISEGAALALAGLERDYGLTRVDGWPIDPLAVYCAVMRLDTPAGVDEMLARIAHDPRVRLAQPLQTFAVHGGYNDPYFSLQYGASSPELLLMHQRATGRGVHIAVIDTGVDRRHPDLAGRIGVARNFVDGDARFDSDIHGTAVAGIIAADAGNGVGIVGLAPGADLLALKACWQTAANDIAALCNTFTLAKALTFAIEQRADVVNLSLGGPHDPLLALLVGVALGRGAVVVAAQGSTDRFPGDVPGVIAVRVAATGATAPASNDRTVIELNPQQLLSTSPGGRYDYFSGSSMAAARVSGLSALLRQEHAGGSMQQLIDDLDQRLVALGARGPTPDVPLVTHDDAANRSTPPAREEYGALRSATQG
jgi:subtilisin family serine protease